VASDCGRLHEKLHNLYTSPYVIYAIKLRRMRWAGYVALIGDVRNAYSVLVKKSE
jgi:hypothetical protein